MLYLQRPTDAQLKKYADPLVKSVSDKLEDSQLSAAVCNYLTEEKIREILTAEPDLLIPLHREVMEHIAPGYVEADYFSYVDRRKEDILPPNLNIYRDAAKLFSVFDYNTLLVHSKTKSYGLAFALNRNTCTYCNRLYTNTVVYKDPNTKQVNDGTRITRPEFDHWFAKSVYPLLSISFYNLIPSCSVCNSSIKGDDKFTLLNNIHPYRRDASESFKFSFSPAGTNKYEVTLKDISNVKMQTHLDSFKIKEVYAAHSDLELHDLIELKMKYSENYLDTLFNKTFKSLSITEPEIYRMIFGVEIEEHNYHKRPFSKFKTDILDELRSSG